MEVVEREIKAIRSIRQKNDATRDERKSEGQLPFRMDPSRQDIEGQQEQVEVVVVVVVLLLVLVMVAPSSLHI